MVFNTKVEYLINHYIESYNLNRRSDTNKASAVNKFLITINNLFNGNVDSFKDTLLIDKEKALTEITTNKN